MKPTKKRVKIEPLKPKPATDQEKENVKGGKTPSPGGPIPIPYPN